MQNRPRLYVYFHPLLYSQLESEAKHKKKKTVCESASPSRKQRQYDTPHLSLFDLQLPRNLSLLWLSLLTYASQPACVFVIRICIYIQILLLIFFVGSVQCGEEIVWCRYHLAAPFFWGGGLSMTGYAADSSRSINWKATDKRRLPKTLTDSPTLALVCHGSEAEVQAGNKGQREGMRLRMAEMEERKGRGITAGVARGERKA